MVNLIQIAAKIRILPTLDKKAPPSVCSQSSGNWIVLKPHQWIGYSGSAHLRKRLQLWFRVPLCSINTVSSVPRSVAAPVFILREMWALGAQYYLHSHCYKCRLWQPEAVSAALGWRVAPSASRNCCSLSYCFTSPVSQTRPWRETWLMEITQPAPASGMHTQAALILKFTHFSSPPSAPHSDSCLWSAKCARSERFALMTCISVSGCNNI